jgi:hypothetical protein
MRIDQFIGSLVPLFKKDAVTEDIRLTTSEIVQVADAYKDATPLIRARKFASEVLQTHDSNFKMVTRKTRGNMFETLADALPEIGKNLKLVGDMIEESYAEDVAAEGLTYKKANLLQYSEYASFFTKYARKFLDYAYIVEAAGFDANGLKNFDALPKAELDWITANFPVFCQVFNVLATPAEKIAKLLVDIPDVIVTSSNYHTVSATMGVSKIDPLSMGLIPVFLNPVYHVGMWLAEWQTNRYKQNQEELKLVQLRKMHLEKLQANKPDANLEKQIDYQSKRIRALNYEIAKSEAKNHG